LLGGFASIFARERNDLVDGAGLRVSVRAGPSFDGRWDALRAGNSVAVPSGYAYEGPEPLEDRRDFGVLVDVDVGWRAFALRVAASPPHTDRREAYVTAAAGSIAFWGGRRGLSLGPTSRGGIVLGESARFTGGGV